MQILSSLIHLSKAFVLVSSTREFKSSLPGEQHWSGSPMWSKPASLEREHGISLCWLQKEESLLKVTRRKAWQTCRMKKCQKTKYREATIRKRRAVPPGATRIKASCSGGESKRTLLCPNMGWHHFHSVEWMLLKAYTHTRQGGRESKKELNCFVTFQSRTFGVFYAPRWGDKSNCMGCWHPSQRLDQGSVRGVCFLEKETAC